jgi:hypothetical protein
MMTPRMGEGVCHIASPLSANDNIAEVDPVRLSSKWDSLNGAVECVACTGKERNTSFELTFLQFFQGRKVAQISPGSFPSNFLNAKPILRRCIFWCGNRVGDRLCDIVVRVPVYRSRGPGFDFRRYQIFWVVELERGPLSVMSTIEELFGRRNSNSGLESREYDRRDPLCWQHGTLYPLKFALTSPTSGGRSIGIARSRAKATEFVF